MIGGLLFLFCAVGVQSEQVTVKVLSQRRPDGLERVLESVAAAHYPSWAQVDVHVYVDGSKGEDAKRAETVEKARQIKSSWSLGDFAITEYGEQRGVREAWLDCADPSVFGDEMGRVLIVEDDVELSPVWFDFLQQSIERTREEPGIAGISLQSQRYRLDAYRNWRGGMSKLFDERRADDELYAFAHVGSWGFSPNPHVWLEFLHWFRSLDDHTEENAFAVSDSGLPISDARASGLPFQESLPTKWYRDALKQNKENSMWTAHFGAFMAARRLFVVHARFAGGAALASSWRSKGEHYSLNKPDAPLLQTLEYSNFFDQESIPRITISGERLGPDDLVYDDDKRAADPRRLERRRAKQRALEKFGGDSRRRLQDGDGDLDIFYVLDEATATGDTSAAAQGLGFGADPFYTLTHEQALCVLDGKKVGILGDSITRYFTWTFNWFMRYGTLHEEFVPGTPFDGAFYDQNTRWSDGYRSGAGLHAQNMISVASSYFSPNDIETQFWFIQDTWYPDMEDVVVPALADYDVLIFNSGWWERKDDEVDGTGAPPDGVTCDGTGMYTDPACLEAYEADLDSLYDGLLSQFDADPEKAVVFRLSTCCGGGPYTTVEDQEQGSIAVSAMNAVVQRVMTDYGVEVLDVEHLISNVNINIDLGDNNDDPRDRSFDGTHPRATQNYVWTQMLLTKIAKQLGRVESCGLDVDTEAPTTSSPTTERPVTAEPTAEPTPNPTFSKAPTPQSCTNGEQDGEETDVDCGGTQCTPCTDGNGCLVDSDCAGNFCFESLCVNSPTPAPSTASPTAGPTPKPVVASPTPSPSVSPEPTLSPVPKPTLGQPQPTKADSCEDSYAGCAAPTPVEFCKGNTCFACVDVQDDGIRYKRQGTFVDRIFRENCPSAGQRMLLALFLACLVALLVACYITDDGNRCCSSLFCPSKHARVYKSNSHTDVTEGVSSSDAALQHPRSGGTSGRTGAHGGALEDELSGSALMVLKQMEAQEQHNRSARGDNDVEMMTRTGEKTNSLKAIAEDEEVDEGKMEPSSPHQPTSNLRRGSGHSNYTAGSSYNRASGGGGGGGGSRFARTTHTGLSSRLAFGGSHNYHGSQRSSRFAEPYADRSHTKVASSVAFSFYDGGDSDDEDEEDVGVPQLPPPKTGGQGAAKTPPEKKPPGQKTWICVTTAMEFAVILIACVVGEHRMPSGFLPAGSRYQAENPDLWTFIVLMLLFVSIVKLKVVDPDSKNKDDSIFLSRAQANEWKGWMQVAFVAYHYTNAQDVYVPVRWFVSAYVWLSGFGNGVYFWSSADFSFKRFAQQLWRINFLCAFLSLVTATPWIDYYFVALATVHFVLIFIALFVARLFCKTLLFLSPPDRKSGVEAHPIEKMIGIVLLLIFVIALWGQGSPDDFGSGSIVYKKVFQWWLRDISTHTENYFWTRTKMDYLSSAHGLAFAAIYTKVRDAWPSLSLVKRFLLFLPAGAMFAVAVVVAMLPRYCCDQGQEYRKVNAYIGTLWIPAYLIARNFTPWIARRISTPMEWIGMHSLEFYLLQFHVFLTRRSQEVLYIIPDENWAYTNMAIVGFIYVIIVVKALEATNVLRNVAWRATRYQVLVCTLWCIVFYTIFATVFSGKDNENCSSASWGVWSVLTLIAIGCFAFWTVTH